MKLAAAAFVFTLATTAQAGPDNYDHTPGVEAPPPPERHAPAPAVEHPAQSRGPDDTARVLPGQPPEIKRWEAVDNSPPRHPEPLFAPAPPKPDLGEITREFHDALCADPRGTLADGSCE